VPQQPPFPFFLSFPFFSLRTPTLHDPRLSLKAKTKGICEGNCRQLEPPCLHPFPFPFFPLSLPLLLAFYGIGGGERLMVIDVTLSPPLPFSEAFFLSPTSTSWSTTPASWWMASSPSLFSFCLRASARKLETNLFAFPPSPFPPSACRRVREATDR